MLKAMRPNREAIPVSGCPERAAPAPEPFRLSSRRNHGTIVQHGCCEGTEITVGSGN